MTATPLQVLSRPFAVEPITHVMLPDGIFDNAIYNLEITCHVTNTSSADLTDVEVYLEGVSDPGVAVVPHTHTLPRVPANATITVSWRANFENASPGKPLVSVVATSAGFSSRRSLSRIFVSQTRYDTTAQAWTCTLDEGTLTMSKVKVIGPGDAWDQDPADGRDGKCHDTPLGPWVPLGFTAEWQPSPAYEGVHGDLPFSDPWWKVVALIVFIIAALVGIIAAAAGAGTFNVGVKGTFEETDPSVSCCTPAPKTEWTVAGVAGVVASVALAVACSDAADPWWRGQEATPPGAGEKTLAEKVEASWSLPQAPNAGEAYTADVEWTYTRTTDASTYTHSVSETQTNIHVCDDVTVTTPSVVHLWDPLWANVTFTRPDKSQFRGPELYGLCVFRSPGPGGLFFVERMTDDGLGKDPGANDGTYAAVFDLERAAGILAKNKLPVDGRWRVFVYGQDVNLTKPGTPPEVAAQTIGGFMVASALTLTFDPNLPCPLKAQAVIDVV